MTEPETLASKTARRRRAGSHQALARARDSAGKFRTGTKDASGQDVCQPDTPRRREDKVHMRTERDYLKSVVTKIESDDVAKVAQRVVEDALGNEETDVKVVNAAREWLGKYLLGNAKVPLSDVENQPAIVKRR